MSSISSPYFLFLLSLSYPSSLYFLTSLCSLSLALALALSLSPMPGVSCSDEDEKPRKRRRTNSSGSSPVVLKEVAKVTAPSVSKGVGLPMASPMVGLSASSPKMSNIMQSIANSLPPHLSPVKITFAKPTIQSTSSTTQKVRRPLVAGRACKIFQAHLQ